MCDEYVVAVMDCPFNLQGGRGYMYFVIIIFFAKHHRPTLFVFQILH